VLIFTFQTVVSKVNLLLFSVVSNLYKGIFTKVNRDGEDVSKSGGV
jgi:hypothetical protein